MNVATSVAPAIAAAVMRARRKIADHFLVHHALSAGDAVPYQPGTPMMRRQFERMLSKGIVHQPRPGQYYLDLRALEADTEARRRRLVPIVIGLAVILAGVLTLFYDG